MWSQHALIVTLMVALAGCATPPEPLPEPPPIMIPQSTWRQVDRDIVSASQDATEQAADYARDRMQRWRDRVYQRTDTEFIPWFSSAWTRQWLAMKVTWYRMNAEGDKDQVVDRLARYLQGEYQERVLTPVAKEINPDWIMGQTTLLYLRLLREQLQGIAPRYGVPLDQFDARLQDIPAIALAPPPSNNASLNQLVHAEPIDSQPAYLTLLDRIQTIPGREGSWSADAGASSVARRASESLTNELATRSVAGAVSSMVGRVAGMAISLATLGFTSMLQENQRPEMEAQLRNNLHAAFDEKWLELMSDRDTGVLAGVYQISATIEGALASSMTQPLHYEEPLAQPASIPVEEPLQLQRNHGSDDTAPYQLW